MVVKSVELNLSQRKQIESTLKKDYKVKSVTTENISSTISNEMQRDAFISVDLSDLYADLHCNPIQRCEVWIQCDHRIDQ